MVMCDDLVGNICSEVDTECESRVTQSYDVSELLAADELELEKRNRHSYCINNSLVPCSPSATSPGAASYLAEGQDR
jgi:hypothetical protein